MVPSLASVAHTVRQSTSHFLLLGVARDVERQRRLHVAPQKVSCIYIYIYDDIMKVNTSESSAFTVPPRQRFLHVSLKCWPPLLDHMLVVAVK